MASIIGVEQLQNPNGTTAATIDSTGRISTPARPSFCARGYAGGVTGQGYQTTSYFATVDHNIGNHFVNSSSTGAKFTAPIAGVYHMIYFMGLRAAHANFNAIHLDKNGSAYLEAWNTSTNGTPHANATVSTYMLLAVGDVVRAGWYTGYDAPSTGNQYGSFSGCFMG